LSLQNPLHCFGLNPRDLSTVPMRTLLKIGHKLSIPETNYPGRNNVCLCLKLTLERHPDNLAYESLVADGRKVGRLGEP
jgi:hypothetical protein